MKPFLYLLFSLLLVPRLSLAQDAPDDPQAGTVVDTGKEKVVILDSTESKDHHYALAWTIRPNRNQNPVDWSTYHRDDAYNFLEKYPYDMENLDKSDYVLVNGVLDLPGKKFMPLPSKDPYFPGYNRHEISVAWSSEQAGTRRALVSNNARFSTTELFLVTLKDGALSALNLAPQADKAVSGRMRKRDPKDYRRYETTYEVVNDAAPGNLPPVAFHQDSVKIHFETSVPKSEVDSDEGEITFALPRGNVVRLDFDKKKK